MDYFDYWKRQTDLLAVKLGKPMQLIRGTHGELSVFPASTNVSELNKCVYVSGGTNE